jgi:hypothetical protein
MGGELRRSSEFHPTGFGALPAIISASPDQFALEFGSAKHIDLLP